MGLMSPDLSLDLRPAYVPESINGFLKEVSMIGDVTEKLKKVDERIRNLEDEMKKIGVFKRELPHCMLLLNDAILVLKQESTQYRTGNGHQPVLEEFITLRKETVGKTNQNKDNCYKLDEENSSRDKKNWMSKVQLFPTSTSTSCNHNQNPNQNQHQTLVSESQKVDDKRPSTKLVGDDLYDPSKHRTGSKGFVPMINTYPSFTEYRMKVDKEDMSVQGLSLLIPGIKHPKQDSATSGLSSKFGGSRVSSTPSPASNGLSNPRPGHQQPTSRKQRRCWSPELHRRFVDALTQLGGPQVATPKQIRELMRVDGLTNDEVKSHLQKYRLHTRRVPNNNSSASTNDNGNCLAGSWGTQDQYSDSSRPSTSQSGSPQGPLQFPGLTGETSTTGCDSMEDDDDEKSESYSWKGHVHRPGKDDV